MVWRMLVSLAVYLLELMGVHGGGLIGWPATLIGLLSSRYFGSRT